jgi:catechol 2,3-dioxygenase-like lactoylglutathione lyase family enzyme
MNKPRVGLGRLSFAVLTLFCLMLTQHSLRASDEVLSLQGRIHFNINTNDYQASRAFYQQLGFARAIGPFPETNTLEMAQSMGMASPYRMYAEIIYLGESEIDPARLHEPTGRMIDLIQWFEPQNLAPAYPALNALGFVKVVLGTDDLNADLTRLAASGYQTMGPVGVGAAGLRFAVLKDPSGTFVELRQNRTRAHALTNGSYVTHIDHLNINVTELERSLPFYQRLGFVGAPIVERTSTVEEALARGFAAPYEVREVMLTHASDGSGLLLSQWMRPSDDAPPHPLPINHAGIQRVNYASADIEADVALLQRAGVQFVSPIVRCCDGDRSTMGIAVFEDPDGIFFQLLGQVEPLTSE